MRRYEYLAKGGNRYVLAMYNTRALNTTPYNTLTTVGSNANSALGKAVYPGLGVNYLGAQANWAAHAAYFKSIGLKYIRPDRGNVPYPWSPGTSSPGNTAYWRSCQQYFHNAGFSVSGGVNGLVGQSTTLYSYSNWFMNHDSIVAEAAYYQQQGIIVDNFEIGNEYEGNVTATILSLTQLGGVATCITAKSHGCKNGDTITIQGTIPGTYSGTFTVKVVNTTTFTYIVPSNLSSPATSLGSCYTLTGTQLNALIRQLAVDVKAVYTLGKISYGCYNAMLGGVSTYNDWIANGLGGLDTISLHPYGSIDINNQVVTPSGFLDIASMLNAFGSNVCYISEFNIDSHNLNLNSINTITYVKALSSLFNTYVIGGGFTKYLFFLWDNFLDNVPTSGNLIYQGFAMLNTNGSTHPAWYTLFQNNPTPYTSRTLTPTRSTTYY